VKIAFVAMSYPQESLVTPPLPIGYLAALLEQQRHIVRIYDIALHDRAMLAETLAPLRVFRPHIVVVASADTGILSLLEEMLAGYSTIIMPLGVDLRVAAPGQAVAQALWWMDKQPDAEDERSVIYEALLALDDDLDSLPFPARHLLQLEQYPLFTPAGDLQTTILTGQQFGSEGIIPRNPALIAAELRSVTREYGIRHFVFTGPPLSADAQWLQELLFHMTTADLGVCWEGAISYDILSPELLRMCRRSGCEVLCFPINGIEVLGSRAARAALSAVVEEAHSLDITVRAHIYLDSTYAAMPTLVDLAATFGLDEVRFSVLQASSPAPRSTDEVALENVAEMVQSRYRSSRSRQFFVERFGPRMGPMLWRVGRAGLLGRTWQHYADGGEDAGGAMPRGYTA
jgi:hypothetical protein